MRINDVVAIVFMGYCFFGCNFKNVKISSLEDKKIDCAYLLRRDKIEKLKISDTNLKDIPDCIFDLPKLKVLDLSNNNIEKIPEGIQKLQKLEYLLLENNKISDLPSFDNMPNLLLVVVINNKLSNETRRSVLEKNKRVRIWFDFKD